jgi:hypothetical protein
VFVGGNEYQHQKKMKDIMERKHLLSSVGHEGECENNQENVKEHIIAKDNDT